MSAICQVKTARQEAEAARQKSQTLLAELQEAHRELQVYAAQAEELAVARERNHLAKPSLLSHLIYLLSLNILRSPIR